MTQGVLPKRLRKDADLVNIAEGHNPLVSILMVVKNGLPSIRRAIESILSQSYTKIELIIQDGVSTDGTIEYISGLTSHNIAIKLFIESDLGPSDAFWRGIIKCNGDLIGFCMSDEMLYTTAIAEVVESFTNDKSTACVYGNTFYTDIDGRVFGQSIPGDFSLEKYLARQVDPILCSTYFRRSCLERIGLYSRSWERNIDTMELWARVALGHKITYINRHLSYYAVHTDSSSNRDFDDDECFIHLRISFINK
ncbi:MAG: glycosyltransferase, partial [Betaproteobacteria bacterium]|nr:glycosyltransferase [Betaproteobacteria bacterium]